MAPMGILTAVVSAIRVCGTPSLRAFIGRAQEGAGNAEAELCTSTSRDVCELYNSGGIARVFGRPKILEVIHDPSHDFSDPKDDTAGIYTFQQYLEHDKGRVLWRKETPDNTITPWKNKVMALWRTKKAAGDTESAPKLPGSDTSQIPFTTFAPNLSLNIGIKKQSKYVFYTIAFLGLCLQVGVLVFAGFATYYLKWGNDDKPPESYACPLVIIGTVLVCGGMFHCAFLIGQSTEEDVWRRQEIVTDKSSMYWIQPGGQIIGDQTFDAFSHTDSDKKLQKYITSKRKDVSQESKLGIWAAIATTISGFVLQFTGLRGIHSAVSVAQLGVILFMSTARAMLRMQRLEPKDNCFAKFPDEVLGHELDWLALRIGRNALDRDTLNSHSASGSSYSTSVSKEPSSALSSPGDEDRYFWRFCGASETNRMSIEHPSPSDRSNIAAIFLAYRTRLASLTDLSTRSIAPAMEFKSEMVEARNESRQIAALIEATIKTIFSKAAKVKKEWESAPSMFWGIDCALGKQANQPLEPQHHTIYLEFTRDSSAPGNPWVLKNTRELEGILGLWVWSLKSDPRIETEDQWTKLRRSTASDIKARRIIPTDQAMKSDLGMWLGDDMDAVTKSALCSVSTDLHNESTVWTMLTDTRATGMTQHVPIVKVTRAQIIPLLRIFGWKTAKLSQSQDFDGFNVWSTPMTSSLKTSCAQELFASFLTSFLDIVDNFGPVHVEEDTSIRLENGLVSEIIGLFTEMQLGSRLEALFCVMPIVLPRLGVPSAASALAAAKKSANQHRERKDWKKAERVLQWAWSICRQHQNSDQNVIDAVEDHTPSSEETLDKQATVALCELYRWALIEETLFGKNGISRLEEKKHDQSISSREVIDQYSLVANEIAQHQASDAEFANMGTDCLKTALLFVTLPAPDTGREQKGQALHSAAKHGWVEVALALLELGGEPDFRDTEGRTALSHAAESGNFTVVKGLMKWGSFPNLEDHGQRTPLSYASGAGCYEVVKLLLRDARVPPDQRDSWQRTPLSRAAGNGHEDVVRWLLQTGQVDPDREDHRKETPLHAAASHGHHAVVERLLETGRVDPDTQNSYGSTPLFCAASNGHDAIVKRLLDTGKVIPDMKNHLGETPLYAAASHSHHAVVERLLGTGKVDPDAKNSYRETPLYSAASKGHDAIVKRLLDTGKVNPDTKNHHGETPLCHAASHGHHAVVERLLGTGKVDPDAKNFDRETPLYSAASKGHDAIVKRLLETGKVDPDMKANGRTPLYAAAANGHYAVVERFLQTGKVDPDSKNNGATPLLSAAENGHDAIVKRLLETGKVDPDMKDDDGATPLYCAVSKGHKAVIKRLLEIGKVNPDTKDNNGNTPLCHAATEGNDAVVKRLLDTGNVDLDVKNQFGQTLLERAAEMGIINIENMLKEAKRKKDLEK
ncbi:unnamed protein product [Penicillium olsonii]|uniref:Uncharacterized protein n=1 Tax=Penicillium olsonii TaxID=99116 RepID=A0A9W4ILF9_PENOL|nr:unnamed protein product [Penicillium olsonii]